MIYITLSIFVFSGIVGYFIGREHRINKYIDEIENLRDEKKYWIDICNRQKSGGDKFPINDKV